MKTQTTYIMKKKILFFLFFVGLACSSSAQFRNDANISFFTGAYAAQKNGNNNGGWYGMYFDYLGLKTPSNWKFGFCALASQSKFKSNERRTTYDGSSTDFGAGLSLGKYTESLFPNFAGYFGTNLMFKDNKDAGEGETAYDNGSLGRYSMTQEDLMLSAELNINILKKTGNLFPRTQLRLLFQKPLSSERSAFWNEMPIGSTPWNKTSFQGEFKQSLFQFGNQTLFEPKVVINYQHYEGDGSNWWALGPEFALKKKGFDNFLSVYFLVKKQAGNYGTNLNGTQFVVGLNFMPFNIKKQ